MPTIDYKNKILKGFEQIFESSWGYAPIDNHRENTIKRKKGLLYFLKCPNIPIENNQCESDIKEKVIKRKVIISHKS
ncbi:MAG: transposase, partial [Oligoflexia bacterium]|nr:transposase [Oligoflexia bacterium]